MSCSKEASSSKSSKRGVTGEGRPFFETYSEAGRVRCKPCYATWIENSVKHAVAYGEDEESARKRFKAIAVPPAKDVPTYA